MRDCKHLLRTLKGTTVTCNRDIEGVLGGAIPYDTLGSKDQAVVRAAWHEAIETDIHALDLRSSFKNEDRARWSEADQLGVVTVHEVPGAKKA